MKLKGDLDSIGLAELFKTLSGQRASGTLAVTSSMGEKLIALSKGEITVLSDKLSERTRLGDLLVARGHLTEAALAEALKFQRASEQRTKLGDLLVKNDILKPENIADALRFQLEEEIFDLFTWKGATFVFESGKGVDDLDTEGTSNENIHAVSIDPQTLIAEATRRMAEWKDIESRLPTMYLCFKLTPKGDESLPKANVAVVRILKLLKEGRTVETTVKRSCMGRFNVCKGIIKLLDEGWIFPYPSSELKFLASEHRANKRFPDALNIYRRMLENTDSDEERADIQHMVDDTIDAIQRSSEAGEAPEGAEIVSYKEAAKRYKRKQLVRRWAFILFAIGGLVAAGHLYTERYTPPAGVPLAYKRAVEESNKAYAEKRFDDALAVWKTFYETLRDKDSPTALSVQARLSKIPQDKQVYIESLLADVQSMEKKNPEGAELAYQKLIQDFPENAIAQKAQDALDRIAKAKVASQSVIETQNWQLRLEGPRQLLKDGKYLQAKAAYKELADAAEEGTEVKREALEGLRQIEAIELQAKTALKDAETLLDERKGDEAITAFNKVSAKWIAFPEIAERARARRRNVETRRDSAQQEITRGNGLEVQERFIEAFKTFKEVERQYGEFKLSQIARDRVAILAAKIENFDKLLETAKTTYGADKARGRQLYKSLLQNQAPLLVEMKVELPVTVTSNPLGAKLKVDDRQIGATPLEVMLPVWREVKFKLEHPDFEVGERSVRVAATELDGIEVKLKRKATRITPPFNTAVFSPPTLVNDSLLILHGTTISAFAPSADKVPSEPIWKIEGYFDDGALIYTAPTGASRGVDKTFWHPRRPPQLIAENRMILPLKTSEIIEIVLDGQVATAKSLIRNLPAQAVGNVHYAPTSIRARRPLLGVAFNDGYARGYEMNDGTPIPLWDKPIADPALLPEKGAAIAGVAPRKDETPKGSFVTLSLSGRLTSFAMTDGEELWKLELGTPLTENAVLPTTDTENFAAFVAANGKVIGVDLKAHAKVFEYAVARQAKDEASTVLVVPDGLYIATIEGILKKYSREGTKVSENPVWERPLDDRTNLPIVATATAVYTITQSGNIYALSAANKQLLWDYRVDGKATYIAVYGSYLYVGLEDGRMVVLKAE